MYSKPNEYKPKYSSVGSAIERTSEKLDLDILKAKREVALLRNPKITVGTHSETTLVNNPPNNNALSHLRIEPLKELLSKQSALFQLAYEKKNWVKNKFSATADAMKISEDLMKDSSLANGLSFGPQFTRYNIHARVYQAILLSDQGKLKESALMMERCFHEMKQLHNQVDSLETVYILVNLGITKGKMGDRQQGITHLSEATTMLKNIVNQVRDKLGERISEFGAVEQKNDSMEVAWLLNMLAHMQFENEKLRESIATFKEASDMVARLLPPKDVRRARYLKDLGFAQERAREKETGIATQKLAFELWETIDNPYHVEALNAYLAMSNIGCALALDDTSRLKGIELLSKATNNLQKWWAPGVIQQSDLKNRDDLITTCLNLESSMDTPEPFSLSLLSTDSRFAAIRWPEFVCFDHFNFLRLVDPRERTSKQEQIELLQMIALIEKHPMNVHQVKHKLNEVKPQCTSEQLEEILRSATPSLAAAPPAAAAAEPLRITTFVALTIQRNSASFIFKTGLALISQGSKFLGNPFIAQGISNLRRIQSGVGSLLSATLADLAIAYLRTDNLAKAKDAALESRNALTRAIPKTHCDHANITLNISTCLQELHFANRNTLSSSTLTAAAPSEFLIEANANNLNSLALHRSMVQSNAVEEHTLANTLEACGRTYTLLNEHAQAVEKFNEALKHRETRYEEALKKQNTFNQEEQGALDTDLKQKTIHLVFALNNAGLACQPLASSREEGLQRLKRALEICQKHATNTKEWQRIIVTVAGNLRCALWGAGKIEQAKAFEIEFTPLVSPIQTTMAFSNEELRHLNICTHILSREASAFVATGAPPPMGTVALWLPIVRYENIHSLDLLSDTYLTPAINAALADGAAPAAAANGQVAVAGHQRHKDTEKLLQPAEGVSFLRITERKEIFVRYTIPSALKEKANKLIAYTQLASRHPNGLMYLLAVENNGVVEVDGEFADADTLMPLIPKFAPEHRIFVAMSVAKQLLLSLSYFDVVHDKHHRNLCPRYVLMRKDGCVKVDVYDAFTKDDIIANQTHFLSLPYTAPECRATPEAYMTGDSKADVWAVGVHIYAIMRGVTLQPRKKAQRVGDNVPDDSPAEKDAYAKECREFYDFMNGSQDKWRELIPDDALRHLARRCLQVEKSRRITLQDALGMTFALGSIEGDLSPDENQAGGNPVNSASSAPVGNRPLKHPWALEPGAFDPSSEKNLNVVGPQMKMLLPLNPNFTFPEGDIELSASAALCVKEMGRLLSLELNSWRTCREDINKKASIDKAMKEVVRKRSTSAWKSLSKAVFSARAVIKGEKRAQAALTRRGAPLTMVDILEAAKSSEKYLNYSILALDNQLYLFFLPGYKDNNEKAQIFIAKKHEDGTYEYLDDKTCLLLSLFPHQGIFEDNRIPALKTQNGFTKSVIIAYPIDGTPVASGTRQDPVQRLERGQQDPVPSLQMNKETLFFRRSTGKVGVDQEDSDNDDAIRYK